MPAAENGYKSVQTYSPREVTFMEQINIRAVVNENL